MQHFELTRVISVIVLLMLFACSASFEVTASSMTREVQPGPGNDTGLPEGIDLLLNFTGLPTHTTAFNGPRKTVVRNGEELYFVYTWMNGTRMTLTMLASFDDGSNWTSPLDIWEDRTSYNYSDLPHTGLYIWNGQFILIWLTGHLERGYRQLLCIKSPLSDWKGLASAKVMTIRDFEGSNWDAAFDEDHIYLAEIRSGEWQGYFYRYDNATWSGPVIVNPPGSTVRVALETVMTDKGTKLLYFYCRPYMRGYSSGNVHLRVSTDGGRNWSSERTAMDNSDDYSMLVCEKVNEVLFLYASRFSEDEIDMSTSSDAGQTWSYERTLVRGRGLNRLDETADTDFSIGYRNNGSVFLLAYEGGSNEIRMVHSEDRGKTWSNVSDAILLHGERSYGISLSSTGDLFSCVMDYGGDLDNIHLCDMSKLVIADGPSSGPCILTRDMTTAYINCIYSVQYLASDPDTPLSELSWSMSTNATWLNFTGSLYLTGKPSSKDAGSYWVNISVSDGKSTDNRNFTILVMGNPDNGTSYPPVGLTILEDDEGSILTWEIYGMECIGSDIVEVRGSENVSVEVLEDNRILIVPRKDWAGTETLTLFLEKDGRLMERILEIDVINRNDPPSESFVPVPGMKIFEGDSFELTVRCEDPDIIYGDHLEHIWYIDGLEYTSRNETLELKLPAGRHEITVISKDGSGESSVYTLEIMVYCRESGTIGPFYILMAVSFAVLVLLIAVLMVVHAFVLRRHGKGPEVKYKGTTRGIVDEGPTTSVRSGVLPPLNALPRDLSEYRNRFEADRPVTMHPSIREAYDKVREGLPRNLDEDRMMERLERMNAEGRLSPRTYEMIRHRMGREP